MVVDEMTHAKHENVKLTEEPFHRCPKCKFLSRFIEYETYLKTRKSFFKGEISKLVGVKRFVCDNCYYRWIEE